MRTIKRACTILGIPLLVYISLAFFTPFNTYLQNRSIENQIGYLLSQEDLDVELQKRYPEGYVFFNALLALSIIEHFDNQSPVQAHTANEVDKLLLKLLSDRASNYFTSNQQLPNGAFYNGWVNFTLKKYVQSDLIQESTLKQYLVSAHDSITKEIVRSQESKIQILDSYPQSYWPADNLMCIASLPTAHLDLASEWMKHIRNVSTSELIHHDDVYVNKPRGSSQSLMIYQMSQFDTRQAKADNIKFHKSFRSSILGIQLIHEDITNKSFEDIDSGPILFGYGSVATIMNAKAQKSIGKRSRITEGFLNVLGLPINLNEKKFYLFRKEIMFDLFMLWIQV